MKGNLAELVEQGRSVAKTTLGLTVYCSLRGY